MTTATQSILSAGKRLDALGLTPATSGNYSVRLSKTEIVITRFMRVIHVILIMD